MNGQLFKVPKALCYRGDPRNWQKFKQQFDIYMKATGLINNESENKVNIFLNIAGEEALEIYNSLKLTSEEKKDFDLVMETFRYHCESKQNLIYKSFKFFTRAQEPSECFNDFYKDLEIMADFCNFGDQKDRLIRDRIIAGIRNHSLQEKFLKEPDLSLVDVVNQCQEDEITLNHPVIFKPEIYINEVEIEEAIFEDEESNNNYDSLINNDTNLTDGFIIEPFHIPNEVLFNDMAIQEDDNSVLEDDCIQEDTSEQQEVDIKPISIIRENKKSEKLSVKPKTKSNTSGSSRYQKKEKSLQRLKKAESIQIKIAEIKKNLSNAIKQEVDSEQMGIRQKVTRSRIKNIEIKCEQPEYEASEENLLEENDIDENAQAAVNLDNDIYSYTEENEPEENLINGHSKENENVEPQVYEEEMEYDPSADSNKDEDYIPTDKSTDSTHPPKKRRRNKNYKSKLNKVKKIFKIERDNLPPLLIKRVRKKTLLLSKMPYPCKKCDSSFWTSVQLERHQLVHVLKKMPPNKAAPKRIFKCEECGREFKKICDLERHTRVHTGEKPSVCNICNKRFQQAYNLNKHLLIHTQEKKYECVICQKKFGRNDVLNRHVLTHSIDKPFHCTICSKTFIRNTQLNLHLRKHHGQGGKNTKVEQQEEEEEEIDDPLTGK